MKRIMKHLQKLLPILFLAANFLSTPASASVDDEYTFTIHIGAFVKAKLADFKTIRPLGYLYAQSAENNLIRIYMSDFETEAAAYKVLNQVKTNGYPDAFVTRRKLSSGPDVRVIQIGMEQIGADVDWLSYNRAGKLQTIIQNQQLKILSGPYEQSTEAEAMLRAIKAAGFKDAFIKRVNLALLHPVTTFEADMELPNVELNTQEAIPQSYDQVVLTEKTVPQKKSGPDLMVKPKKKQEAPVVETPVVEAPREEAIPQSYDQVVLTEKAVPVAAESIEIALPKIRKNVKRKSVLELQKILKKEKAYSSSLDGYYGKGTAAGWTSIKSNNQRMRKYRLLAKHQEQLTERGSEHILQHYINTLYNNPSQSIAGLENAKEAIAKAYRAYYLLVNNGNQQQIDQLMNSAIQSTFGNNKKLENKPPFDYTATYSYTNVDQLILHLSYLHGATSEVATPAWLFQKHPTAAAEAFKPHSGMRGNYQLANADDLFNWDELKLLQVIAEDLAPIQLDSKTLSAAQSTRARLLLAPKIMDTSDQIHIEGWNRSLWNGLDAWAEKDPVLKRIAVPLKVTYYQSQVRLEDYFMGKGFKPKAATHLALATLKTIVNPYLKGL